LRESDGDIEREGMRRAREQLAAADHALVIIDANGECLQDTAALIQQFPDGLTLTIVRNKIDLTDEAPGKDSNNSNTIRVSALTGAGVDELRQHIKSQVGFEVGGEGMVTARRRHLDRLTSARTHFEKGRSQLLDHGAGELMADELLQAQNALAEITGEFSSDDLLGKIFSSFCIGK
jgi:tRNA modification GTPase